MTRIKKNSRLLFERLFKQLNPPPNITLSQWADKYRMLSSGASAEAGHWNTARAEYQREVMDAISNIDIPKVVIMAGAQMGKTDGFLLNTIGYYMHYDPAPIMVLQPTLTMAEAFSKEKLVLMLRDTPVLRNKISEGKRSGNTILQKIFPGGHITMVGSKSPQSLASRPIRILLADEVDRYPASAGNEGDPLFLAGKRQTTFWNRKEVYTSTPTNKGTSRIELEYEHSSKGEWNVPCPECGKYQPLVWENVIYEKGNFKNISYVCQNCGVILPEATWKQEFNNGRYIHEYPKRKTKGYHINALASTLPGASWEKIVEDYEIAKNEAEHGNIELMKVWKNTVMGQTWEADGEELEADKLENRKEKYKAEVPDEVICLTAGVDTQDDRFEIEIVGWGAFEESWGIKYARIYGDLSQPEIWQELDDYLMQTFQQADGTQLKIIAACIDSGGHFSNEVCKFTKSKQNRRVFAIKGRGGAETPYISAPTKNNRYKAPMFILGVDTGKSLLYERLKVEEPGPNYCHFPIEEAAGYDERYFKGLTAEKQVLTYKKGHACYAWELKDPNFRRNEPFDIRNYATAALKIANPVLKPKKKGKTTEILGTKPQTRRRVRSSGVKI